VVEKQGLECLINKMKWLFSVLAFAGASANADITYYFGGTLSSAFGTLPAGTQFNGSFSYAYPQSPIYSEIHPIFQLADYIPQKLNVVVGSQQLSWINSSGEARIRVINNHRISTDGVSSTNLDSFLIMTTTYYDSVGGELIEEFGLLLGDESGRAFSSNALANESMKIDQFNYTEFYFGSSLGPSSSSNLTYLIPEPYSLSLLALGGVMVGLSRRRK